MSISQKTVLVFNGTKTNDGERARLMSAGFVHATGLACKGGQSPGIIGAKVMKDEHGQWNVLGGMAVIVTLGGEVWLRPSHVKFDGIGSLLPEFCPNGQGGYVPCCHGEEIGMHDLMSRYIDPSYGLSYE